MRDVLLAALLLALILTHATACSGGGSAVPPASEPASEPASAPATPEPAAPAPVPGDPDPRQHPPAIPLPADILPSEPGEEGARAFVAAFLRARETRDAAGAARARDFLSPTALEQAGDALAEASGWEIVSFAAADANSYEVKVRGQGAAGPVEETLFVGPGPDASGASRVWIVRGIAPGGSRP